MRDGGADHRRADFENLYRSQYAEIVGFVRRRVGADAADDVVAGVFAVAWRRFDSVPAPPHDRLWLFGVARRAVADHHRSQRRRLLLRIRLAQHAAVAAPAPVSSDSRPEPVLAAMRTLRPAEREALRLVLWDELSHADAAAVLGCTVNAFELRYRRARHAVRDALASQPPRPAATLSASAAQEKAS